MKNLSRFLRKFLPGAAAASAILLSACPVPVSAQGTSDPNVFKQKPVVPNYEQRYILNTESGKYYVIYKGIKDSLKIEPLLTPGEAEPPLVIYDRHTSTYEIPKPAKPQLQLENEKVQKENDDLKTEAEVLRQQAKVWLANPLYFWLLIGISVLLFVGFVIMYLQWRKMKDKLEAPGSPIPGATPAEVISIEKQRSENKKLVEANRGLESKTLVLTQQNAELKMQFDILNDKYNTAFPQPEPEPEPEPVIRHVYYAGSPRRNTNSFVASDLVTDADMIQPKHHYILETEGVKGTFQLNTFYDDSLRLAFSEESDRVQPFNNIEGKYYSKVEVTRPGTIELQAGNWVITSKANILLS
ncbi:MAG: hypothetical protein V4543_15630 [Bacteroidota bacterium]